MEESEEDEETLAAIDRGIQAADEGRVASLEEVRKMIPEWIRKFESGEGAKVVRLPVRK
jgi:predicted transcriptional regulator